MSLTQVHKKITSLQKQMEEAAEALDFETATRLRNEIAYWRGQASSADDGAPVVSQPPPGAMGLGTHLPVVSPPKGWKKPKKPDPMTGNVKPRRGR